MKFAGKHSQTSTHVVINNFICWMSTHLRSADALKLTQAAQKGELESNHVLLEWVTDHEEGDIRVGGLKQHLVHMLLHHLLAGHRYLLDIYIQLLDATKEQTMMPVSNTSNKPHMHFLEQVLGSQEK